MDLSASIHAVEYHVICNTCLQTIMDNGLLNKGGTILLDNALFFGQVYSEDRSNETTPLGCCVRECLDFIKEDSRVQRVNESITRTCPCNIQRFFSAVKIENFIRKNDIFNIIAQNIDRASTHNLCFGSKIEKNRFAPTNPSFSI